MMATQYSRIDEVKEANRRAGQHFFEPATMRFFDSRIGSEIRHGRYFVTSERFDYKTPRYYTIREAMPDGKIETVGAFQEFGSARAAWRHLERYIAARAVRFEHRGAGKWTECSADGCAHLASFLTRTNAHPCDQHLFDTLEAESRIV